LTYIKGNKNSVTMRLLQALSEISTARAKPYPLPQEVYPDLIAPRTPGRPSALATRPILWKKVACVPAIAKVIERPVS
jgi:hypothetical protein